MPSCFTSSFMFSAPVSLWMPLSVFVSFSRWFDLEEVFGRSSGSLCITLYAIVEPMMAKRGFLFSEWRVEFIRERAPLYAKKIVEAGAYLDRCVGFIDGSAVHIARAGGGLQTACYSDHKRKHAIKFQSAHTPDGLVFHLFGPLEGRRHDMTLYHESGPDALLPDALMIDGDQ